MRFFQCPLALSEAEGMPNSQFPVPYHLIPLVQSTLPSCFRYKLTGEGLIRTRGIFVRLLTTVAALRCYLTKRCSENKLIAVTEN